MRSILGWFARRGSTLGDKEVEVHGASLCTEARRRCRFAMRPLQHWYRTPVGHLLESVEREALARRLDRLTGAASLQLGGFGMQPRLRPHTGRHWLACERPDDPGDCLLRFEQLPFQSQSMDIVVSVHALEFSDRPHQVLREAERVLVPEGALLLLCFNPISLWGAARAWRGGIRGAPRWQGRYLTARRTRDWVTLLGLELERIEYFYFRPPWNNAALQGRLQPLENVAERWLPWFGGVYLLTARKHVAGITPLRPSWRRRRGLTGGGLPQPTSRNTQ